MSFLGENGLAGVSVPLSLDLEACCTQLAGLLFLPLPLLESEDLAS